MPPPVTVNVRTTGDKCRPILCHTAPIVLQAATTVLLSSEDKPFGHFFLCQPHLSEMSCKIKLHYSLRECDTRIETIHQVRRSEQGSGSPAMAAA